MEDAWAWHPDHRGCFSVKSAYKLCRQLQMVDSGEVGQANRDSDNSFRWSSIWHAPCPNKVKQFLWRMAHNSLPLCTNLKRKGVDIDTLCPVCKRRDEDGSHLLFQCKQVKQLWRELGLEEVRTKCMAMHDRSLGVSGSEC